MQQAELLDRAMSTARVSQRDIAKLMGLQHSELVRMRQGERKMQFAEAAFLAELAKLPPVATAARLRAQAEKTKRLRDLMTKIATTAAVLLLGVIGKSAQCHTFTHVSFDIKDTEYTYAIVHRLAREMLLAVLRGIRRFTTWSFRHAAELAA